MSQLELTDIDTDSDTGPERPTWVVMTSGASRAAQADALRESVAAAGVITGLNLGAADRHRLVTDFVTGDIDGDVVHIHDPQTGDQLGDVAWSCRQDTADTPRIIAYALESNHRHMVVDSFATLGQSVSEVRDRIETAVDGGLAVHVASQGLDVTEETADAVLGVLDGLDAVGPELAREAAMRDVQEWTGGFEQTRGRAPLGFEYRDGELVTAENFDEVRGVLKMVDADDDELPKSRAADRLDTSSRTITRAIEEHRDRYGLDEPLGK